MGNHDDRAGKLVDRLGKGSTAVDVQMVGRLVENDHVGTEEGRQSQQQPGFFAARQTLDQGVAGLAGEADRAGAPAHLGLSGIRHQLANVIVGRAVEIELVDLVLNGASLLASSLTSVDLPLPLEPSKAMRSSVSIRSVTRLSTGFLGS